jgi:hypothetical protein
MSPEETGLSPAIFALIGLLGIVGLVSFIWVVVIAFKEHILWGFGCLFIPLVIIVFGIVHWDKAKKPFLVYIIVSIIMAVMYVKIFYAMFQQAGVMDLSTQVQTGQITEQEAQQRIQQRMAEMFGVDTGQMPATEKPQSTEDKISSLTEQMNERAQQAEQETAAPAAQRIKVFKSFRISQARQYLGETVRVVTHSDIEKQGKLKEVKYDRLVLERNLRGGDFAFEVLFDDIKTLEVEQWETL